jgi:hypothetical protein
MQDRLKPLTFTGILEHAFAQSVPVNPATGFENILPKAADDFIECRLPGLGQATRDLIGIDDRHATRGQERRHRGFSAANATGKANS